MLNIKLNINQTLTFIIHNAHLLWREGAGGLNEEYYLAPCAIIEILRPEPAQPGSSPSVGRINYLEAQEGKVEIPSANCHDKCRQASCISSSDGVFRCCKKQYSPRCPAVLPAGSDNPSNTPPRTSNSSRISR